MMDTTEREWMRREFEGLLVAAHEVGASDLHLSVRSVPTLRIDGSLRPLGTELLTPERMEGMARAIMTDVQFDKFAEQGELDFAYGLAQVSRFRVNAYRQRGTVSIAARVIPSRVPTLDELSLPDILTKLVVKPHGLILITGPTGSGKSTTLAALLDYLNCRTRKHIITLEDPIEYLHKHDRCVIDQREIGLDTKDFASGLRACLRQDPDVIMVGEMRDPVTISTAITAAETGHLVLATLHTPDAPQTIDRIVDSFPGDQQSQVRVQLASVLEAIISQRLLPRRGSKGRVCATEILLNTPAVSNLIRTEKVHQIKNMMQTGAALGMHTLEASLRALIREGAVEEEEARPFLKEGTG